MMSRLRWLADGNTSMRFKSLSKLISHSTLFWDAEVSYILWICETPDSLATIGKELEDKQYNGLYS